MGSKFLAADSAVDLTELQLGTYPINIASAVIQSLAPNLPVRTNADRMVTSGLIQLTDCAFAPLTNPASANLNLANFAITNVKETSLQSNAAPSTPDPNMLTVYTSGDRLRYKDNTTATYQVATLSDLAAYLLKSGGTMSGAIAMATNNITNIGSISGAVNSRLVDNIASISGAQTTGNIAMWSTVTKALEDSGVVAASVVTGPASVTSGNLATFNTAPGRLIADLHL